MTLKYTLFRKPGNLQEFADKLRRKGVTEVEVFGAEGPLDSYLFGGLGRPWYIVARDKSGKLTYAEQLYFSPMSGSLPTELTKKLETGKKLIEKAKEWREYLMSQGLRAEVVIFKEDKPIPLTEEIEKEIQEQEAKAWEKINELSRVEARLRH